MLLKENNIIFIHNSLIFAKLKNLEMLAIDNNQLIKIDKPFDNLINLNYIFLQDNKLSNCFEVLFLNNKKLNILILSNNSISTFNINGDYPFDNLTQLDLSHNKLSSFDFVQWLINCSTELKIYLRFNEIVKFDINWIKTNLNMDVQMGKIVVDLNYNPIICDCNVVPLLKYMDRKLEHFDELYDVLEFDIQELKCDGNQEDRFVKGLYIYDLLCDLEQGCPEQCDCKKRPADQTLIINCSFHELYEIPMLPQIPIYPIYLENVELIVDNNNLTELTSANYSGFNNITMIMASNNQIYSIGLKHLPVKLKTLDIRNNSLQFLDDFVIERFENISKLYLSGNPWRCDCDAVKLLNFFNLFRHLIMDAEDMICKDGREFKSLKSEDLCFQYIYLTVFLLIVILLICSCYIIFLTFKKQIKVWLYYHNCCLWWVTEETLDKDKDYDAFIVFSHFDDSFVTDLILDLEMPPNSFKCCVHLRDWIPGEMIVTQVSTNYLQ